MKKLWKTKKGKWLIGLTILAIIAAGAGYYKHLQDIYDNQILHTKIKNPVTTGFNAASVKQGPVDPFTKADLLKYRKQALRAGVQHYPNGYLEIPSINVALPIYNHTNNLTLSLGVGKDYYLDSQYGKGNFVLAGHNMDEPGVLLSNLYQVKLGQTIILHGNNKDYKYRITSKKVQSPYVKIIDGKPVKGSAYYLPEGNEKPIVTVYDCTFDGSNRLVVQGELMDK